MFKYQAYFSKSSDDVLKSLNVSLNGLTSEEVKTRVEKSGLNLIEYEKPDWKKIFARQFSSFFIYLLFIAAVINFATRQILDACFIVAFICVYVGAGFYQEFKAENSVFNLRKFLTRYVRVKRNDEIHKLSTQELVPGDLVFLEEGDLVPADVRFIKTRNLNIDESILTGESLAVFKNAEIFTGEAKSDLDAKNIGFSGSTVIGGTGEAVVIATGETTYFADIFEKLNVIERPSQFEINLKKIGKFLTFLFFVIATLIFLIKFLLSGKIDLEFFVFVVALVVAVVPEALPLVATLAFSQGSLILAKNNVVIKRLTALEDLGNIDILCTDKTGTITENKLTVTDYYGPNPEEILRLAMIGSIASKKLNRMHGSFDNAIIGASEKKSLHKNSDLNKIEFIESLPFDPIRKVNSVLYKVGEKYFVLSRGAPEVISKNSINLSEPESAKVLAWFKEAGLKGGRVLAIGWDPLESTCRHASLSIL